MAFPGKPTGAGRAPAKAYGAKQTERDLQRLVDDPLNHEHADPEYRDYVSAQFRKAVGTDPVGRDATGRQIAPSVKARRLDPFKPTVRQPDLELGEAVGPGKANDFRDVFSVQKVLSNTGDFEMDMTRERGGALTRTLAGAIERFQTRNRLTPDGVVNPGGPTIRTAVQTLFDADGTQRRSGITEVQEDGPIGRESTDRPTPPSTNKDENDITEAQEVQRIRAELEARLQDVERDIETTVDAIESQRRAIEIMRERGQRRWESVQLIAIAVLEARRRQLEARRRRIADRLARLPRQSEN